MNKTLEFQDVTLAGPAIRLHLRAIGNPQGRPVLFLHGITENARSFEPLMRLLPDDLYALALDLRGRGESDKPASGYGLSDYADDLLVVWNRFSGYADKPVLVGHSMGGRIACAFAARYPELVAGLVLIDPPISGPGRPPFPTPLSRFVGPKRALAAGDMASFRSYYSAPGFDYERKAQELETCAEEAIALSYEAMNAEPFHAYYRMLRVPALLVVAGQSPLIPPEAEEELRSLNPAVEVVRMDGVGHEIHKLAPERLAERLLSFLFSLS